MSLKNYSFLFKYLERENINIDQKEFVFQLNSHPETPSLLAISDTLSFFNINNLATKIDFEDIIHLPKRFVALLNEENLPLLTLVEKDGKDFKIHKDKKIEGVSKDKFNEIFQNIVLLAEKEEVEKEQMKSKFSLSYLLLVGILFYIGFLFLSKASINVFLFSFLSIVGVYFSVEAIFKELGIQSKFSDSVCNIISVSDCNIVLKSKSLNFLGQFNYSNFSVTFFSTQLLLLFVMQVANKINAFFEIQYVFLLGSIPVTFMSFYHQIKIAKKWCPICLFIIALLYIELFLIYFAYPVSIEFNILNIIVFLFLFSIVFFLTTSVKDVLKIKSKLQEELSASNRFKRNYKLFDLSLKEAEVVNIELNEKSLVVGNSAAKLKITLITSPFCGFCKEAHKVIEKIYKTYKEDLCINFQFNYNIEKTTLASKEIHHKLVQIYFNEEHDYFIKSLRDWFEQNIMPSYEKEVMNELKINEILNQQFISNKVNEINFTPCVIINDKIFPKIYDLKDLRYFVSEMISEFEEMD